MDRRMKIRIPIYLGILAMVGVFRYYLRPKWEAERLEKERTAAVQEVRAQGRSLQVVPPTGEVPSEAPRRSGVMVVVDEDLSTLPPPVREAAAEARATVDTFRRLLAEADAGAETEGRAREGMFSLLVQLRENGEHERFWLQDVTWRDGAFHGRTESIPRFLRTIGARYPVEVEPEAIFDWIVKRPGLPMEGAFTARAWAALQESAVPSAEDAASSTLPKEGESQSSPAGETDPQSPSME